MVFPFAAVKLVGEAFKEKHANNPDWKPQRDRLEELFDSYRTEARWLKTIQHLRDDGKLSGEPKDIGLLMKELANDLITEEGEDMAKKLLAHHRKAWISSAMRGLPEFYKDHLLTEPSP